mmetsp:Transcript_47566/g.74289  ORF Transcript_47566/g.74289 Transcript_47566/m.74289 type:complete len:87 (+) Transcript_47566:172-432(+)
MYLTWQTERVFQSQGASQVRLHKHSKSITLSPNHRCKPARTYQVQEGASGEILVNLTPRPESNPEMSRETANQLQMLLVNKAMDRL